MGAAHRGVGGSIAQGRHEGPRGRDGGFFCFFLEKAKGKNQSIEDITRGTSVCALLLGFVQPREALRRNETTLTSEDFR